MGNVLHKKRHHYPLKARVTMMEQHLCRWKTPFVLTIWNVRFLILIHILIAHKPSTIAPITM